MSAPRTAVAAWVGKRSDFSYEIANLLRGSTFGIDRYQKSGSATERDGWVGDDAAPSKLQRKESFKSQQEGPAETLDDLQRRLRPIVTTVCSLKLLLDDDAELVVHHCWEHMVAVNAQGFYAALVVQREVVQQRPAGFKARRSCLVQ